MHEFVYVWINYFWASLKGNGPEALVQTVAYAAVAVAVYPPLRKWATKEERAKRAELHSKVDHIIKHHPDIPDYVSPGHTDGSVQA